MGETECFGCWGQWKKPPQQQITSVGWADGRMVKQQRTKLLVKTITCREIKSDHLCGIEVSFSGMNWLGQQQVAGVSGERGWVTKSGMWYWCECQRRKGCACCVVQCPQNFTCAQAKFFWTYLRYSGCSWVHLWDNVLILGCCSESSFLILLWGVQAML